MTPPLSSGTQDVLNYLRQLPEAEHQALAHLRTQILEIAPAFTERLSRGVPFFYYLGKRAVGFRASQQHLSLFIMEGQVFKDLQALIAPYDPGPTVIRFRAAQPLPDALIERLVLARMAEIEAAVRPPSRRTQGAKGLL